jgi:lipoyl-dependent peroxiredoxin
MVLYTANVTNTGGREGHVSSSDNKIDTQVTKPIEMGGTGEGTNPEQLFAAAYSTCYGGALKFIANKHGVELPTNWAVEGQVSMNQEGASMFLSVKMIAKLPGMDKETADKIATIAHNSCPYTRAVKGNIETELVVETAA